MKYFLILMLLLVATQINSNAIQSTSGQTDYSMYVNSKFKLKPQLLNGTDFEVSVTLY
jgi:hypothetical protein